MANQKSGASKQLHLAQTAQAEAIFNSIGDGAISTDEYGRITRVNPVAQRLLQYSESELVGEWFPKKIVALNEDGQPLNLIERPITRAFLTGKNISEKLLYKTKKGSHLPLAFHQYCSMVSQLVLSKFFMMSHWKMKSIV
jgi:PAS domain S-box-containing protein